jgi:hypothetical protein
MERKSDAFFMMSSPQSEARKLDPRARFGNGLMQVRFSHSAVASGRRDPIFAATQRGRAIHGIHYRD